MQIPFIFDSTTAMKPSKVESDTAEQRSTSKDQRRRRSTRETKLGRYDNTNRRLAVSNASLTTAVGAALAYASLRGGIKAFHLTRRCFLRQLLFEVSAALNLVGVCWWLDFGSLLGIHRDGDLIPHDNDIDLAVLNPDWADVERQLAKVLPNYKVAIVTPSEDENVSFARVYCPLAFADVFGATHIDDDTLLVDCGHGDCTSVPAEIVLPVQTMEWRGQALSVPGRLEEHLEHRYGSTWRTPLYMDKGKDVVEQEKMYAKIFKALGKLGIRL